MCDCIIEKNKNNQKYNSKQRHKWHQSFFIKPAQLGVFNQQNHHHSAGVSCEEHNGVDIEWFKFSFQVFLPSCLLCFQDCSLPFALSFASLCLPSSVKRIFFMASTPAIPEFRVVVVGSQGAFSPQLARFPCSPLSPSSLSRFSEILTHNENDTEMEAVVVRI